MFGVIDIKDWELLIGGISERVHPKDIHVQDGMISSTFGKCEVERSAGRLVLLLQHKNPNKWEPFTLVELYEFYKKNVWDFNEALHGLSGLWYDDSMSGGVRRSHDLIVDFGHAMHVTNEFIRICSKNT